MWNPAKAKEYADCIINTSPYFLGTANGVIEEVKGIPQLISLGTELALNQEKRDALVDAFMSLTPAKISSGIVNAGKQIYGNLTGTEPPQWHAKGTYTVQTITIFLPGGILGKADDALTKGADDVVDNFSNETSKLDELAGPFGKVFDKLRKKIDKLTDEEKLLLRADLEENIDIVNRIDKAVDPESWVDAWKVSSKYPELRKNPELLEELSSFVKKNNLGMSKEDLAVLFNRNWDLGENIMPALKRASDANISGLKVSYKKFPQASSGNNYVLDQAKKFQ